MKQMNFDVVVIGGGMSGISAAIAAARQGVKVALLQDRPVLGGNASSEIRMHICGATRHGEKKGNFRETGIIEEILLENKYRNPAYSYGMFDTLLWEKVVSEENITLFLNTYVRDVKAENGRVISVTANQLTTEKEIEFSASQFIDCSGDGFVSYKAGAEYMFGRESKDTFGEPNAVDKADKITMGNSIQFRSLDAGHPVPFQKPDWAYDYSDTDWADIRTKAEITSGYWWVEIGGTEWDCIKDSELTRDEMLKIIYGLWDFIKNHSENKKAAENYYLDWVSFIPAKRESRRIKGDYVLNENDVLENRRFDDAIAYGGWHLDSHRPEGFYAFINDTPQLEDKAIIFDGIYTIPYRSIYAKDFSNLLLGGRIISASHRAFSSSRVMATCAVVSEASGIAAAMAVKEKCDCRKVNVSALQQELLKNGCYIPNVKNNDQTDKARTAAVSASTFVKGFEPENIINGVARPSGQDSNMWQSDENDKAPSITLDFKKATEVKETIITFDSNLDVEIMISLSKWAQNRQSEKIPDTIVKDYKIDYCLNGKIVDTKTISNNHQRMNNVKSDVICDKMVLTVLNTNGFSKARICEMRVY